jgi:DNA (cytosine-5)-methyltransferase 1
MVIFMNFQNVIYLLYIRLIYYICDMKILNLYAGIGGNRKLWGNDHEITAVEYDKDTAAIYSDFYPKDEIVIGDAHYFLLDNFKDYDFIWASPPCPTHSRLNLTMVGNGWPVKYPDMTLYQEIILLQKWFKGLWVVENVIPYYEPLIPAKKVDRHLWWSNFYINEFKPSKKPNYETASAKDLQDFFDIDLTNYNPSGCNDKRKMLRNMVHPETGLHVLNCALKKYHKFNEKQISLF